MVDGAPMSNGNLVTLQAQGAYAPSSFVAQFLRAASVLGLDKNPRCQMLAHRYAFYEGTQHDHQPLTWDGLPRDPGVGYLWERLRPQGFVPVNAAPYAQRKPDAPVPLARQIVSRFTEMLLGEGRTPALRTPTDEAAEAYLSAAFESALLWDVFTEARDFAGACGAAVVVLGVRNGVLTAETLHPKDVWVAEWDESVPGWVPRVVIYQCKMEVWVTDPETGELKPETVWRTRMWTDEHVVTYEDVPVDDVPEEGIPVREVVLHGLGMCPVVWYQNTRCTQSPDGVPDCDGAWPLLDKLDRLQSQVGKAAIANTDPTLVLKEPPHTRRRHRLIEKGSNHVIPLPPEGEARYLEMQGSSVQVGMAVVDTLVSEVLQTVECVIVKPEYAKAYQSGEALQLLWRAMESKANRLRVSLATAIKRACRILLRMAEVYGVGNIEDVGTPSERRGVLLPPRKVAETAEVPSPEGEPPMPLPEPVVRWEPHKVPKSNVHVTLEWPPYWTPTPQQVLATTQALVQATGAKQIVSADTATRHLAQMLGKDGDEEVRKVAEEQQELAGAMESAAAVLAGVPEPEDDIEDDTGEEEPEVESDGVPEEVEDTTTPKIELELELDESGPKPTE